MGPGSMKIERIKNGVAWDMKLNEGLDELVRELQSPRGYVTFATNNYVYDRLQREGSITLADGTKYTLLTLRWV